MHNSIQKELAELNKLSIKEYNRNVELGLIDEPINKSNVQEIIIKSPDISINNAEVNNSKIVKPESLDEYIGQSKNKRAIKKTINIIKTIKPINILLYGYPGTGKSNLAQIIAKELDARYIYTIPEQLKDIEKIKEVLNTIQSEKKLVVWCLDECQNIDKKTINILLPVLQDRKLGNVQVKDFVLIGATTDYNKVYKKSEALVSRFQTRIIMNKYTVEELIEIQKLHKSKMNIDIDIPEEDYRLIAKNSKGIPREALNLLLNRMVSNTVQETLEEKKIIKDGITETDIKILKTLNKQNKPIGSNFLSQKVGLIKEDYEMVYEPYLVEKDFIDRSSRGREITNIGKKFLKELK